jgi:hypothetical protein
MSFSIQKGKGKEKSSSQKFLASDGSELPDYQSGTKLFLLHDVGLDLLSSKYFQQLKLLMKTPLTNQSQSQSQKLNTATASLKIYLANGCGFFLL